ncbi:MAG: hypothetical protein R6V67_01855 [Spirochaetia bacterium]
MRTFSTSITKEQSSHRGYLAKELDNTPRNEENQEYFWDLHYKFHMTMAEYIDSASLVQTLSHINLFMERTKDLDSSMYFKSVDPEKYKEVISFIGKNL